MICPFRKTIRHNYGHGPNHAPTSDVEEYGDCYEDRCPFFVPERMGEPEHCIKADREGL